MGKERVRSRNASFVLGRSARVTTLAVYGGVERPGRSFAGRFFVSQQPLVQHPSGMLTACEINVCKCTCTLECAAKKAAKKAEISRSPRVLQTRVHPFSVYIAINRKNMYVFGKMYRVHGAPGTMDVR